MLFQTEWWHNTAGVISGYYAYTRDNVTYEKLIKLIDDTMTAQTWNNLNEAKEKRITPCENAYRNC